MRRFALYSAVARLLSGAMLTVNTRLWHRVVSYLFRDHITVCTCGSGDLTFRPATGPLGSVHRYYDATCKRCGERWQVVDVAWDDPRKVIDATLEAAAQDPPGHLEQ
jgi:hypothetical protein